MNEPTVMAELFNRIGMFLSADLDSAVRRRAELCLIDSITCFSAGLGLKHFKPSAAVASSMFGNESTTGAGSFTPSTIHTAYIYGQAANALDYDDTLLGHPGAPIVAAILAVGARENLSMDRLLRGIAAGYEAHWVLASAATPSRERAALVRSVGVWDTVAAGIGAAVSLGKDPEFLERLVGVALSHSLLPYTGKWYERPVPALKNNLGWAAAGAVMALDLVQAGQTGVSNPLDGSTGMWRMAGSDQLDLTKTRKDLPAISRVGFKHFPACWHLQEYLKTLASVLPQLDEREEIAAITVAGPADVEKFCQQAMLAPADVAFSLPATFSLLISNVEPGPRWDEVADDSPELRYKSRFAFDLSDKRSIKLETTRGRIVMSSVEVSDPHDLANRGLDESGVVAKYERLSDPQLRSALASGLAESDRGAAELYQAVHRLIAVAGADKHLAHPR
ncbi:MmgE/PrpD family protein (plasmid) [Agrobacterium leguminum]|uniref:MmgE/PrpD family protein n=1 Tax=Agrobacterium TaxID=357 RepID=UPI0010C9B14F|nr:MULTISPECIES: MmgE/PrpD family protein [Agrobacterium]WFS69434.1 MmgE/PrpD family protein [Agrobacterium leguminum]